MLQRSNDSKFPSLTDRFVKYAKVMTQADENSESYPSSACQLDLARILVADLQELGVDNASVDKYGYVTASIPANDPAFENVPVIAFMAHMDTYPEVSGENVVPTFHENYQGGDIALPNDGVVIKASENPYLAECVGETIITADGTTLLGADDKAGVAEIMEAMTRIIENPEFKHGPFKIAFTPDQSIFKNFRYYVLLRIDA